MTFQWDDDKNESNFAKHGVTFDEAKEIFEGPVFEFIDDRQDYGETRIAAIGVTNNIELTVIYTMRREVRRIISARRASRDERRTYYYTHPR